MAHSLQPNELTPKTPRKLNCPNSSICRL